MGILADSDSTCVKSSSMYLMLVVDLTRRLRAKSTSKQPLLLYNVSSKCILLVVRIYADRQTCAVPSGPLPGLIWTTYACPDYRSDEAGYLAGPPLDELHVSL
jgi:hypothetical protein